MPAVNVGNIRITTTFKTSVRYTKEGGMVSEKYMYTSYRNLTTGKTATAADLKAVGIKNRQRPSVKLTPENASFLFNKAQRAEAGELNPQHYTNLLGSKSYGVPTEQQKQQFKGALIKMFDNTNPTDAEMDEWEALVEGMTADDCQEFYSRYQTQLNPGFVGYRSQWATIDSDKMMRYTGKDEGEAAMRRANSNTVRRQLLSAIREFVNTSPMVQKHLDDYYDITPKRR